MVIEMVIVEVAPVLIAVGEKLLVIAGANPTTSVAVAGLAFDPPLVTSAPAAMVLTLPPAFVLVTFTDSVQLPPDGIVPPVKVTEPLVWLDVPPQVLACVAARVVTPTGSVSVSGEDSVSGTLLFGFVSVIVSVEVPPERIEFGENALLMVGGLATVSTALAGLALEPKSVVSAPAAMVLV